MLYRMTITRPCWCIKRIYVKGTKRKRSHMYLYRGSFIIGRRFSCDRKNDRTDYRFSFV